MVCPFRWSSLGVGEFLVAGSERGRNHHQHAENEERRNVASGKIFFTCC